MMETEFDRRLRAWLEEGPGAHQSWLLASVVDHARSHRQRPSLRMRWRDVLGGDATWSHPSRLLRIALVAGLVAAVAFAGGIYVGSRLPELGVPSPSAPPGGTPLPSLAALAACPPGSHADEPGPAGQLRPAAGTLSAVVFDRRSGRIVTVSTTSEGALWTYDACANAWHRSSAPGPWTMATGSPRVALGYDAVSGRTLLFGDPILSFDPDLDLLTARSKDGMFLTSPVHVAYRTASRTFIVLDLASAGLMDYDPAAQTWQELPGSGDRPPGNKGAELLAYDSSVDRLVLYMAGDQQGVDRRTYEYDFATQTWRRPAIVTPEVQLLWGDLGDYMIAYDESHARTVVAGTGRVIAYDATRHAWEIVYDSPGSPDDPGYGAGLSHRVGVSLVYDPVNRRSVAIGGNRWAAAGPVQTDDVVAFDLGTRQWVQLLAPTVR